MKTLRQELEESFESLYKIKIFNRGICVYCGARYQCYDHFIPLCKADQFKTGHILLASCNRCNNIAGAKVFLLFEEKQTWIAKRLMKIHKTAVNWRPHNNPEQSEIRQFVRVIKNPPREVFRVMDSFPVELIEDMVFQGVPGRPIGEKAWKFPIKSRT